MIYKEDGTIEITEEDIRNGIATSTLISEEADKLSTAFDKWTAEHKSVTYSEPDATFGWTEMIPLSPDMGMEFNMRTNVLPVEFIKNVKFQYSERTEKITTIVWFADGTKTTSTPADGDVFKKRVGIEQCILKKIFGNRSRLKKLYERWC